MTGTCYSRLASLSRPVSQIFKNEFGRGIARRGVELPMIVESGEVTTGQFRQRRAQPFHLVEAIDCAATTGFGASGQTLVCKEHETIRKNQNHLSVCHSVQRAGEISTMDSHCVARHNSRDESLRYLLQCHGPACPVRLNHDNGESQFRYVRSSGAYRVAGSWPQDTRQNLPFKP